jgi:TM2 domain-containing membrane protein YozV
MVMRKQEEALFWSIALPGFGQLINGKFIKGILFLILEFRISY